MATPGKMDAPPLTAKQLAMPRASQDQQIPTENLLYQAVNPVKPD